MLRAHRVIVTFSAKQLHEGPLLLESFVVGELLVILDTDGQDTIFCRRDDPGELDERRRFVIHDQEFAMRTEAV